jgi:sulfoxide reductase catalytic subunit YedY
MLIKRPRGWQMPEREATPESVFFNRRQLIKGIAAGPILAAAPALASAVMAADEADPTADLYPATRNESYALDRAITDEKVSSTYNNFYEFGSHKRISRAAQQLRIRPWTVTIDGLVEKEMTVGIDDLIRKMPIEERLYRHRCVEAWSMAVPWTGFAMKALVDFARPLGDAKYVEMKTFHDKDMAPGQRQFWYPWPYTEGLTIEEASNELAFLVTGVYGKPAAKQFGAPLRLAVPWKYGFKSAKSLVSFTFKAERPKSFWEEILPKEYGFWANVNPAVSHPRWSQAEEEVIGTGKKVPTLIYNGYGEYVAELYKGLENERLFA